MSMQLPAVQRKILTALCESLNRYGELPTLPALSRAVGLQDTAVQYHLEALRHKGFIRRDLTTWGGVTVECEALKEEYSGVQAEGSAAIDEVPIGLPLAGDIAAGIPIPTDQGIEEHLNVAAGLVPSGADSFVLKVRGDSMKDAGILDSDLVVVRRQETADDGDIVAALVDGEATIKRFSRRGEEVLLLPANPTYEPIDARQASILGKVVTVLRLEPTFPA
jgi:repressor LexA